MPDLPESDPPLYKLTRKVDSILVEGVAGTVSIRFGGHDWQMPPDCARQLAFALMTQADRAENGPYT